VPWSSPLKLAEKLEGRSHEVLLKSSPRSWAKMTSSLQPDFKAFPQTGFMGAPADSVGAKSLAVSLVGSFPSYFAEKPSPLFTEKEEGEEAESEEEQGPLPGPITEEAAKDAEKVADRTGRTLKLSTPDARLVVIGSSAMMSDMVATMDFRSGTDSFGGNLVMMKNLVDWSLADTDLLQIRTAGHYARTLRSMTPRERSLAELANYLVVLLALAGVAGVALTRRRSVQPLQLV
jgi:ABC-2 type transport system permease protein